MGVSVPSVAKGAGVGALVAVGSGAGDLVSVGNAVGEEIAIGVVRECGDEHAASARNEARIEFLKGLNFSDDSSKRLLVDEHAAFALKSRADKRTVHCGIIDNHCVSALHTAIT